MYKQIRTLLVLNVLVVRLVGGLVVSAASDEVGVQSDPVCLTSDLLEVYEGFLSEQEVDRLVQSDVDGEGVGGGVFHGKAFLSREIIARLPRDVDTKDFDFESCSSAGDGFVSVRTKVLLRSSRLHSDNHDSRAETDKDDNLLLSPIRTSSCRPSVLYGKVKDEVSFIFLNTNPSAKFMYANAEVPVVAGNLVKFMGDVDHQTLISKGHVHLAGPFHLSSLQAVTNDTPEPSDQPSSVPTVAPSGTPSSIISNQPSSAPSMLPASVPTMLPSGTPNGAPVVAPSQNPGILPSLPPSQNPSKAPVNGSRKGRNRTRGKDGKNRSKTNLDLNRLKMS